KQITLRRQRPGAGHIPRVCDYIETRFEKPTGQPEANAARCDGDHCCLSVVAIHGYTDRERTENDSANPSLSRIIGVPSGNLVSWSSDASLARRRPIRSAR